MVYTPTRSEFNNAGITPFSLQAMDWTTEFITPRTQAIDKHSGALLTDEIRRWNSQKGDYEKVQVARMTANKELDCLESMGRRVVGALFYAALAVAVEVELVFRTLLYTALLPFIIACEYCDDGDWSDELGNYVDQMMKNGLYAIDAPIRALSGIVQKCLLNLQNNEGGKTYRELALCQIV
ncbi:MAG: hypothetical protein HYX48_02495 [Chlamydiales bacterium]|nr:hypothetical protein [Chlamydiales bacterium]